MSAPLIWPVTIEPAKSRKRCGSGGDRDTRAPDAQSSAKVPGRVAGAIDFSRHRDSEPRRGPLRRAAPLRRRLDGGELPSASSQIAQRPSALRATTGYLQELKSCGAPAKEGRLPIPPLDAARGGDKTHPGRSQAVESSARLLSSDGDRLRTDIHGNPCSTRKVR